MKFIRTVKVSVMVALFAGIGLSATADQQGTSAATNKPPLKVLSIGNSFSQSALVHTPVVAKAMGCELAYTHLFIGGCRLRQHAANMMSNHFPYVVQRTGRNNVYETPLDKCCKPRNVTTWENDCVGSVRLKDGRPAGDSIHLGKIGKYLQGLVWVGALYGVDVSDCPYKPEWMDDETAALCRRCAKEALAENILEPAAAK